MGFWSVPPKIYGTDDTKSSIALNVVAATFSPYGLIVIFTFDIASIVSFNEAFLSNGNRRLAFKRMVSHLADVCRNVMHGFLRTTDFFLDTT